jgi:hypothetical protein
MKRRTLAGLLSVAISAAAMVACDADDPTWTVDAAEQDDVEARDIEENGFRLNGFRLNGFRLNGFRLNGFRLNGDGDSDWIELQKITVPNQPEIVESWLVGSNLHVKTKFGVTLAGAQLTGAELDFGVQEAQQGKKSKKVKITSVKPLQWGSSTLTYGLQIKDELSSWEPLCVDDNDQTTTAILIGDAWDPETGDRITPKPDDVVTFACRGAALAKCVEWGYAPWRTVNNVSLANHHQTCTRAARADYCGDGTSHTKNGTKIHLLDKLGIQIPDLGLGIGYAVEGEWGPDGAVCLNPANTRLPDPDYACAPAKCSNVFNSGGLIQTGIPVL